MSPTCLALYPAAARDEGVAHTAKASATMTVKCFTRSLGKRKRVHGVAGGDGHELAAVHRVAHGRRRHVGAGLKVPQMLASLRVERDDVAVANRAEQHVAGRRQDA